MPSLSLREKGPNTEFFWSVFSRIWTEYGWETLSWMMLKYGQTYFKSLAVFTQKRYVHEKYLKIIIWGS